MKPIYKAWLAQIEVTSACMKSCTYCTRYCRHIRKDQQFYMTIEQLEQAIDSLHGWPNKIGVIGGEPTQHPDFEDICRTLQRLVPKQKLELFTTGGKLYEQYRPLIIETFGAISCNEHTLEQQAKCLHQPITVAINEAVPDKALRDKLIDNCWVQRAWCPSIAPNGAFFCEVAYAIDMITNGPGGWPVKCGWWMKDWHEFRDQVDRYCGMCGMAIPMERDLMSQRKEKFSPQLLAKFKALRLNKITENWVQVFDKQFSAEDVEAARETWDPANYRQDLPREGNFTEMLIK